MQKLTNLIKDDEGATLAEYGLLIGVILIAVATIITTLGTNINKTISNAAAKLT